MSRYDDVIRWLRRHNAIPRHNPRRGLNDTIRLEHELAFWLKAQRARQESLSDEQYTLLDELPGFQWDPLGSSWQQRHDAYEDFLVREARTPRIRSTDAGERALAVWYRNQRRASREGVLPYPREVAFRRLDRLRTGEARPDAP